MVFFFWICFSSQSCFAADDFQPSRMSQSSVSHDGKYLPWLCFLKPVPSPYPKYPFVLSHVFSINLFRDQKAVWWHRGDWRVCCKDTSRSASVSPTWVNQGRCIFEVVKWFYYVKAVMKETEMVNNRQGSTNKGVRLDTECKWQAVHPSTHTHTPLRSSYIGKNNGWSSSVLIRWASSERSLEFSFLTDRSATLLVW